MNRSPPIFELHICSVFVPFDQGTICIISMLLSDFAVAPIRVCGYGVAIALVDSAMEDIAN